jgi:O-acetyl-ADP-ribose deacetylase (regulator of RNase III)
LKQFNAIQIETIWGYKSFEIYQGDITNLDFSVDILAVSVAPNCYIPVKNTVVGALFENHKINLEELLDRCEFDLREPFSCWVSKEISNPKFKRLLCAEILYSMDKETDIQEIIESVFIILSILESKEIEIKTIALPLLGTGILSNDINWVIKSILDYSLKYLQRSQYLNRVILVAYEEEKAELLDKAMNEVLHRVKIVLPKEEYIERIKGEFITAIEEAKRLADDSKVPLFLDLNRIVLDRESRSFELGIVARKLVEFIVEDISQQKQGNLNQKVENLRKSSKPKIAEWITFYMHVLRVLGNEAAHEIGGVERIPIILSESDLEICLLCICRLMNFWLDFRKMTVVN